MLLVEGAGREGHHLLVHDELVALVDEPARLLLLLAPLQRELGARGRRGLSVLRLVVQRLRGALVVLD